MNKLLSIVSWGENDRIAAHKRHSHLILYLKEFGINTKVVYLKETFIKQEKTNYKISNISGYVKAARLIYKYIKKYKTILCSTPVVLPNFIIFMLSLIKRKKCILDIRDISYETIETVTGIKKLYYVFLSLLERIMFSSKATILITVSVEMSELIKTHMNIKKAIYVVENGTIEENFKYKEEKTIDIIYLGSLPLYRKPEKIALLCKKIKERFKDLRIVFLSGNKETLNPEIKAIFTSYELMDKIEFLPLTDYKRMIELASSARIGLIALQDTPAFYGAIGAKVYDYLTAGIPIIALAEPSVHPPLKAIVADTGIITNDTIKIVEWIENLYKNQSFYKNIILNVLKKREALSFKKQVKKSLALFKKYIS